MAAKFTETVENGAVSVTVNGKGRIEAINLGEAVKGWDLEQLEDMLTVVINRAIERTDELKADEGSKSIQNIIPPGLSGLFGR